MYRLKLIISLPTFPKLANITQCESVSIRVYIDSGKPSATSTLCTNSGCHRQRTQMPATFLAVVHLRRLDLLPRNRRQQRRSRGALRHVGRLSRVQSRQLPSRRSLTLMDQYLDQRQPPNRRGQGHVVDTPVSWAECGGHGIAPTSYGEPRRCTVERWAGKDTRGFHVNIH